MHNPFELSDALIRDLPHVRVTRHAPQEGRACEYRKRFKPEGLGDAAYWVQRENEFLLDFTVKRLRHTVELAAFAQGGTGLNTPVVELVATRDAGVTIEDWLRVQPRYDNGAVWQHPFQHAGMFLLLLRACLAALQEIHALGIVHCDIKEDNICLPYSPYPYAPDQAVLLDFERVKLIDFAFSVTPERPLERPLPILPVAPYQSNLLKTALSGDRSGKNRGGLAVQQIDYRADLYSLGYLGGRILNAGLLQPAGSGGAAAMAGARSLVDRLQAYGDDGRRRTGKALPHEDLIGEIDGLLGSLVDLEAYRRFEMARVRDNSTLGAAIQESADGLASTPLTPLATPAAPLPQTEADTPRRWPMALALAALAGLGLFGYWQASQPPPPPPIADKPVIAGKLAGGETAAGSAAKKRAELEAKWKAEAEAQLQAEEAKAKAEAKAREEAKRRQENAARAKAELAEEVKAEATKPLAATNTPSSTTSADEAKPQKPAEQVAPAWRAAAKISYPKNGGGVERQVAVSGSWENPDDSQHAFLVIRSKAEAYGRLYYPQGELPHSAAWSVKGIFATPNYDYEAFVVVTDNPQSVEILKSQKSRAYGLKSLPDDTQRISDIISVKRLQ